MSKLNDIADGNNASQETKTSTPKSEVEALNLETAKLAHEAAQLAILEKRANLQDIEERLAERELAREQKRQKSISNGQILKQNAQADTAHQRKCNHRKGGNGAVGVVGGQGDDTQYAVLKHTFANGDMWVRCLRCGKTWKPPVKEIFASEELFLKAVAEYEAAVNFQTRNVASAGCQFRFSDNGQYYRQVTANTTLR